MSLIKKTMPGRTIPPQHQETQPGLENRMHPQPVYDNGKPGLGRLTGKTALITGGDSGIGRAVAVSFAKEGADVAIIYLNEDKDARDTAAAVQQYGKRAFLMPTDITQEQNCRTAIEKAITEFGHLDLVVNNAAVQFQQENPEEISAEQLQLTFQTNIFSQIYMIKYALPHLKEGASIINTASITAFKGHPILIDYAATKGAIVSFTRSLSQSLIKKGIRVNAVAPGPVWTPLIPASFDKEKVAEFGKNAPMGRPAQPFEIAPCYVFLACEESIFMTGQTLHPNGGSIVNA